MEKQKIEMRLVAGIPSLIESTFPNLAFIDSKDQEFPSVELQTEYQSIDHKARLMFSWEEPQSIKVEYVLPKLEHKDIRVNIPSFTKPISSSKFDTNHVYLEKLLSNFIEYVERWNKGERMLKLPFIEYMNKRTNHHVEILTEYFLKNNLNKEKKVDLTKELKQELIRLFESEASLSYIQPMSGKIAWVYCTDCDEARSIIRNTVNKSFDEEFGF